MKQLLITLLTSLILILSGCGQSGVYVADDGSNDTRIESERKDDVEITTTERTDSDTGQADISAESAFEGSNKVSVFVCGKVKSPGVYELSCDARVCDAIDAAGGVLEDGNGEAVNQASRIEDGQKIYIPAFGEDVTEEASLDTGGEGSNDSALVNINTADKEKLKTLTGIGDSKADLIINYRNEHGPFKTIESLMDIPGIKEGVFNKIKSDITV